MQINKSAQPQAGLIEKQEILLKDAKKHISSNSTITTHLTKR